MLKTNQYYQEKKQKNNDKKFLCTKSMSTIIGLVTMSIVFIIAAPIVVAAEKMQFPTPVGTSDIVKEGSIFERIYGDGCFTEGVAAGHDGLIYFSDITLTEACNEGGIQAGAILRYNPMAVFTYELHEDGSVGKRKTMVTYEGRDTDGPDGMTVDSNGNIYVTGWFYDAPGPGVYVYSPEGKELAFFSTGDEYPTNVEFGRFGDKDMMYVTAGGSVFRIQTNTNGYFLK